MSKNEALAWRMYPEPNGTFYTADELLNEEKVIELFDFCQIYEAIIFKNGWDFLIEEYGCERLFKLNNISDWMDCADVTDFKEAVMYERNSAPHRNKIQGDF